MKQRGLAILPIFPWEVCDMGVNKKIKKANHGKRPRSNKARKKKRV